MIKFFGLIPRKPGMPVQHFHDHWRHPHGTLALPTDTFRGYVQSHQFPHAALGADSSVFEGFAEIWFDDLTDAAGFATHPQYVNYVKVDEPNFVDLPRLKWLNTEQDVVVSEPDGGHLGHHGDTIWSHLTAHTSIKLLQFLAVPDPLTRQEFSDCAIAAGAVRAVRCNGISAEASQEPAFVVVRELWWPTLSHFEIAFEAHPEALAQLLARPGGTETALVTAERFL